MNSEDNEDTVETIRPLVTSDGVDDQIDQELSEIVSEIWSLQPRILMMFKMASTNLFGSSTQGSSGQGTQTVQTAPTAPAARTAPTAPIAPAAQYLPPTLGLQHNTNPAGNSAHCQPMLAPGDDQHSSNTIPPEQPTNPQFGRHHQLSLANQQHFDQQQYTQELFVQQQFTQQQLAQQHHAQHHFAHQHFDQLHFKSFAEQQPLAQFTQSQDVHNYNHKLTPSVLRIPGSFQCNDSSSFQLGSTGFPTTAESVEYSEGIPEQNSMQ
jgi:hypothetical protein